MLLNGGIQISRTTLAKWIIDGAQLYLRSVYDMLHQELIKSDTLHGDETVVQVLREKVFKPEFNVL